ncbi:hypothetical protein [Nonomuraea dietziae]|uniref:hypothetical protein n=1 Tax=Nonomuraea dietziae TaxID=65515 RepID=UPI0034212D24
MAMEEQQFFGRLISQMTRSTIAAISFISILFVTMLSTIVLTPEHVNPDSDGLRLLFVAVPAAVSWLALYLFEIPRAWLVALIGGMFIWVLWRLVDEVFGMEYGPAASLGGIVAYPLAVMVAGPRMRVVWRVLPLALFAGLFWLGT